MRLALKLATGRREDHGDGNAHRLANHHQYATPEQEVHARFLVVAPGLTSRTFACAAAERSGTAITRVAKLIPGDMWDDINRAKM